MAQLRPASVAVSAGRPAPNPGAPLSVPIATSVTFRTGDPAANYLRADGSETIQAFEAAVGALEGGTALAFGSGMAAEAAVIEGLPSGAVAVIPANVYSTTCMIFDEQERLGRMTVRRVDITDTGAVVAALAGADLVWIESPTNPLVGVADLPVITAAARDEGALSCVDSTWNSPVVVRPLEHGADVVVHSATKYLSGHSDALMGVAITAEDTLAQRLHRRRDLTGAVPGALETYLALRGLRTLVVRMERAQANAMILARRLHEHPAVSRVRFPGLADDPGHERATRLHEGYGAMLSYEVHGGAAAAEKICAGVRLITDATSLGGVETLMERRARYDVDAANGAPENLIRLSVGIEDVEDLWSDLAQALESARA